MSKIITITNTKGGVSKTTTSIYLATLLSRNYKVLLKDADPQGSATEWLENCDELPFDFEIANIRNLDRTKDYDFVVIDTPPQNADIIRRAIEVADFVIIPTTPSGIEVTRMFSIIDTMQPSKLYRVLLTMADNRTNSFKSFKELLDENRIHFFKNYIPKKEAIKNCFGRIPKNKDELLDYSKLMAELGGMI